MDSENTTLMPTSHRETSRNAGNGAGGIAETASGAVPNARLTNGKIELVPIERLKAHPRNPRKGNVEAIRALIREHGFYGVLPVQRSTGFILRGNHCWKARDRVRGAIAGGAAPSVRRWSYQLAFRSWRLGRRLAPG
jgi:hypothetical protein